MARDAAAIDALRAGVPDIYRPREAAGGLSNRFSDSVDLLRKSTALQGSRESERDRLYLGMAFLSNPDNAESANPGFLLPGTLRAVRAAQLDRRRREETESASRVRRVIAALDQKLAELNAELRAIDDRLKDIRDRRDAIGKSLDAIHDIEERRRSGAKLDARDAADRALLEAAGLNEVEANGDDYAAVIARRRADLSREDSGLETEWNAKMKRRGEVLIERAAVQEARAEIENADAGEATFAAGRRAETVLGAQQLGEAAYQTKSEAAKVIAADGVAGNERADLREGSEAYNRRAVAQSALNPSAKTFVPS